MSITFRQSGPPLTQELLDAAERAIGLQLPEDCRAFLLEQNGGVPHPDDFSIRIKEDLDAGEDPGTSGGKIRKFKLHSFCPVGPLEPGSQMRPLQSACARLRDEEVPARLAVIGEVLGKWASGTLTISCEGEDRGQIYLRPDYYESPDEGFYFVARSLSDLLGLLSQPTTKPVSTPQKRAERAILEGDLEALAQALLEGIDPARPNSRNVSLLDLAASEVRPEALLFLIDQGARLDQAFLSAVRARNVPMVVRLLDRDPGPSSTAFVTAWLTDRLYFETELVRVFLDRGAEPNQSNTFEGARLPGTLTSPLHGAAQAGNLEAVRLLLGAGADPNVRGGFLNQTPLHMCVMTPDGVAIGLLLLERGARVGLSNDQGMTALHMAVLDASKLGLARKLLDAGEDLQAPGLKRDVVNGEEILTRTRSPAMFCSPKILEELMDHVADRGRTPPQSQVGSE